MKPRIRTFPMLATVATAFLVACGGGGGGGGSATTASTPAAQTATTSGAQSGTTSQPASGGASSGVTISNFKFAPASITVKHGAGLKVTNNDSTAHTATADDGHSFDTPPINPGSSKTITVTKPGTYPYHCSIHPFMHGKLVVS